MKNILKALGIMLLLLIAFVLYITATTGFYRSIDNTYTGAIQSVDIAGAEDFAIDRAAGFLIISSDDRAARRDGDQVPGALYFMGLDTASSGPIRLEIDKEIELYPHGISMIRIDSHTHRLLVVNHVSSSDAAVSALDPAAVHSIEEFILRDTALIYVESHIDAAIFSPNDVVAVDETAFYYTNDHGSKTALGLQLEDFVGLKRSNVGYYDGSTYTIVAEEIAYANGINYDSERSLLYVASPRGFHVKVYEVKPDGRLDHQANLPCHSGVDNIELDASGRLWIGCHPKLLSFTLYAEGQSEYAPSELLVIDYNTEQDYRVRSVYVSDGHDMSGATTAVPYKDKVYVGNVMDDHFIILDKSALDL